MITFGNPFLLIIIERLVQWDKAFDVVVPKWDFNLKLFKRGHVHDILDDSEGRIVSISADVEVFSVDGKLGSDRQNDGIPKNTLGLEFALFVWIHGVEFSKIFINNEVGDSNAEYLKCGVHRLKIFEWSCVSLGLRNVSEIDDFDLG